MKNLKKTAMIIEYADECYINEYDIIRETVLFQESTEIENNAKKYEKTQKSQQKALEKAEKEEAKQNKPIVHKDSLIKRIKNWFKNIARILENFIKKIFHIKNDDEKLNVKSEEPPKIVNLDKVRKGHDYIINSVKTIKDGEQSDLNLYTDKDWSLWQSNLEYYVLGDFAEDVSKLCKASLGELGDEWNNYKQIADEFNNRFHLFFLKLAASRFADATLFISFFGKLASQRQYVKKTVYKNDLKHKWVDKITIKDFEKSVNVFKNKPSFTSDGHIIFNTGSNVEPNKNIDTTLIIDLDPKTLELKCDVSIAGANIPMLIRTYSEAYYKYSELYAKLVKKKDVSIEEIVNEFEQESEKINRDVENISKRSPKMNIYEFCDALKLDGKTFEKAMEYTNTFINGISNISINNENSTDERTKQHLNRLISSANNFINIIKAYRDILYYGKHAIVICKVFVVYLELIGDTGVIDNFCFDIHDSRLKHVKASDIFHFFVRKKQVT